MKSGVIPAKWTTAKVRVNGRGQVQVALPASSAKRNPRKKRNESVEMGFWRGGVFHPIRASDNYDPEAVGEAHQYAKRKKRRKR